jgi:hypothetical protein
VTPWAESQSATAAKTIVQLDQGVPPRPLTITRTSPETGFVEWMASRAMAVISRALTSLPRGRPARRGCPRQLDLVLAQLEAGLPPPAR